MTTCPAVAAAPQGHNVPARVASHHAKASVFAQTLHLLRLPLPARAMNLFSIAAAATFLATSAAPTPLYHLYQEDLHLSALVLTLIFSAYPLSLLAALLTVGSLSDYIGRRPVIFVALVGNAIAMAMFIEAHSAVTLIAARIVQGFAAGAATTALAATILDTNRVRGPLLNAVTPFAGLTLGSLGSSTLVTFGPDPMQLIFIVLLVVSAVEAGLLLLMPETANRSPAQSRRSGRMSACRHRRGRCCCGSRRSMSRPGRWADFISR